MTFDLAYGSEYSLNLGKMLPSILEVGYSDYKDFVKSYLDSDVDFGKEHLSLMLDNLRYHNGQLIELTGEFKEIPIALSDKDYHTKLNEISMGPMINLLKEKPKYEILSLKDYTQIIDRFLRVYDFQSFQEGRSLILDGSNLKSTISPFEIMTKTFYLKWRGSFRCKEGIPGKKDYGILVAYIVYSQSGEEKLRKFLDAIEGGNPTQFYIESPDLGLEKTILGDPELRKKSERSIRGILSKRSNRQLSRLSPTARLRQGSDRRDFRNFLLELYPVTEGEKPFYIR